MVHPYQATGNPHVGGKTTTRPGGFAEGKSGGARLARVPQSNLDFADRSVEDVLSVAARSLMRIGR